MGNFLSNAIHSAVGIFGEIIGAVTNPLFNGASGLLQTLGASPALSGMLSSLVPGLDLSGLLGAGGSPNPSGAGKPPAGSPKDQPIDWQTWGIIGGVILVIGGIIYWIIGGKKR